MRDLDELLQNAAQPKRNLSSNFTARVVAEIKAQPSQPRKEIATMKRYFTPLIATLAVVATLLIGGVTYAATDGFTKPFNLNNIFGYTTISQQNGQKVLAVKTANCTLGTVDGPRDTSDQTLYFRIKDTSVNEADALKWLQGYCENIGTAELYSQARELSDFDSEYALNFLATVESFDGSGLTTSPFESTDDGETKIDQYLVSSSTEIKQSNVASSTMTKGDAVTIVSDSAQADTTPAALFIIHQSDRIRFYNDNYDAYHAALERVKPCGTSEFCSYGSTSSETDAEGKGAVEFVKTAYEEYQASLLKETGDWSAQYQAAKQAFAKHTTSRLSTALETPFAADPILCTQQIMPDEVTFGTPVVHGSIIVVPAMQSEIFADVSYSPALKKITSIDCTQGLAN